MWKSYYTAQQAKNLIRAHGVKAVLPKKGEVLRIVPPLNSGRGVTSIRPSAKKSTYNQALYLVVCYPPSQLMATTKE